MTTTTGERGAWTVRRVRDGERPSDALLATLQAAGVDLERTESTLYDWLDGDALDDLVDGGTRGCCVAARVWGRRVLVSEEAVSVGRAEERLA